MPEQKSMDLTAAPVDTVGDGNKIAEVGAWPHE